MLVASLEPPHRYVVYTSIDYYLLIYDKYQYNYIYKLSAKRFKPVPLDVEAASALLKMQYSAIH